MRYEGVICSVLAVAFSAAAYTGSVELWDDAHETACIGQVAVASSSTAIVLPHDPTPRVISVSHTFEPVASARSW